MQKPTVPDAIQAPAGEELLLMARATGFQIYVCRPGADGKPAWTLKAPEAELFDEQGQVDREAFWRAKMAAQRLQPGHRQDGRQDRRA
ncbi:MAG: DUF3455 domain-containing protein [Candidatus Angelobacter sp.]